MELCIGRRFAPDVEEKIVENKGLVANCGRITGMAERRGVEMLGYLTLAEDSELKEAVLSHATECAQCAKLVWEGQKLWMCNHPEFGPDSESVKKVRDQLQRSISASTIKNGQAS